MEIWTIFQEVNSATINNQELVINIHCYIIAAHPTINCLFALIADIKSFHKPTITKIPTLLPIIRPPLLIAWDI